MPQKKKIIIWVQGTYKKILPPHTTSVVQSGGKHLDTASDATAGAAATAAEAPEALDPELCAEIRTNFRSKNLNQKRLTIRNKSFRICLLNSTANPAHFHPNWAGWIGCGI